VTSSRSTGGGSRRLDTAARQSAELHEHPLIGDQHDRRIGELDERAAQTQMDQPACNPPCGELASSIPTTHGAPDALHHENSVVTTEFSWQSP